MDTVVFTVLGVSALLGLASLMLPVARRFEVPYTVLLGVLGIAIGSMATTLRGVDGVIGDFFKGLSLLNLSSDAFLYVFLPPLLFAAGLSVNVRRLMDDVGAVILLAVVAVIVCTACVGLAVHLAVPQYGLAVCLLLGAIVATTDSAAVVAIFRDIGAPKRLSIVAEGESLFNDAAAIAIFTVILAIIADPTRSVLQTGMWAFTYGLVGGVLVGWSLARAFAVLIGRLRDAALTEITLTLCLAYLAFILAEHYAGVSGVIAVVTAAMVMGAEGRTRISPEIWDGLVDAWKLVEFIATTFIFTFAAMMAPNALRAITADTGLVVLVIFLAAIAARVLVLYGFLPMLSRFNLSSPFSGAYKAVLVWGGLRGAVTVALALAISENSNLPGPVREFILVSSTSFVVLTLLVMAPSLRPLMKLFGLESLNARERMLRDRVMGLARKRVRTKVREMADDLGLSGIISPETKDVALASVPKLEPFEGAERGRFALVALASRERELYMTYFKNGIVDRNIADLLRTEAGRMIDAALTGGSQRYLKVTHKACGINRRFRFALRLQRRLGLTGQLSRVIADRLEMMMVMQLVLRDLKAFVSSDVTALLGPETAREIDTLLDERTEMVDNAIALLDLQYPSYAQLLRTRYMERVALGFEDAEYRDRFAQALIGPEVFEDLQADRRARLRRLEPRPTLDLGLKLTAMLQNVPFLAALDSQALDGLSRLLIPHLAVPEEMVIRRGRTGDRMYFITSGTVEVRLDDRVIRLGEGDFFGEMALLHNAPRNADVVCVSFCNLLVLRRRDFRRVLRAHGKFRERIEAIAAARETT